MVRKQESESAAPTIDWYRWLFRGTQADGLADILAMKAWSDQARTPLAIFILPAGAGYGAQGYALSDLHEAIIRRLAPHQITVGDDPGAFAMDASKLFTDTDHLTLAGSRRAAAILAGFFVAAIPSLAPRCGAAAPAPR